MTKDQLIRLLFSKCMSGDYRSLWPIPCVGKRAKQIAAGVVAYGVCREQALKEIPTLAGKSFDELPKHWRKWFTCEAYGLMGRIDEVGGRVVIEGLNLGDPRTVSRLTRGSHWKKMLGDGVLDYLRLLQEWYKMPIE